jgi:hypothetical protein
MSVQIIRDTAALDKMSKELVSHIKDTDERINSYLLSECLHIEEHRNPTRLNQFFTAVKGSGQRVNAMHNFVQFFANLSFNEKAVGAIKTDKEGKQTIAQVLGKDSTFAKRGADGQLWAVYYSIKNPRKQVTIKVKKDGKEIKQVLTIDEHFERAQTKPWYTFQPERPTQAYDVDSRILGVLKSVFAELGKGTVISERLVKGLVQLAYDTEIVKGPSDIVPKDKFDTVPNKFREVLHLTVIEGGKSDKAPEPAEMTDAEKAEIAKTLANSPEKPKATAKGGKRSSGNPGASLG